MTVLNLLPYHDMLLQEDIVKVPLPGMFLESIISGLYETMYYHNALGLAGPQVGRKQQIAVMDVDDVKLTLINPEIIEFSSSMVDSIEGCLSCPDIEVTVQRYSFITIKNYNIQGVESFELLEGQASLVAQHEIEHLKGILITNHLSSIRKDLYKRKLKP